MSQLGQYTLLDKIGGSVLGTVYRAVDTGSGRTIALKVLRLDMLDDVSSREMDARLTRDFQAVSGLTHPGIAAVYDLRRQGDTALVAMELVEGPTITTFAAAQGGLDVSQAVTAIVQILEALAFAHSRSMIHRDVKPSNVLVSQGTRTKITDFGMAELAARNRTETGLLVGTTEYMAPEQFLGRTIDERCDIHATGTILYQLLTGGSPFADPRGFAMPRVLDYTPPPPSKVKSGLTTAFDPIVARALAKLPGDRFATAQIFRDELCAAYVALTHRALPKTLARIETASDDATPLSEQSTIIQRRPLSASPTAAEPGHLSLEADRVPPARPAARVPVSPAAGAKRPPPVPPEIGSQSSREAVSPSVQMAAPSRAKEPAEPRPGVAFVAPGFAAAPANGPIRRSSASPGTSTGVPLTDASIALGGRVLARFVGPIALVLSRKAAQDARDERGYFELLAAHLSDTNERTQFFHDIRKQSS